jgi:GT2 family glycosyltransferase
MSEISLYTPEKLEQRKRPIASIVVLSHNSLEETTKPCLESIVKTTPLEEYQLVLVDNGSTDGTAEYLRNFAAKHEHVTLCLNDINKGFAGGNNDGLRLATGEYIVLLNNDTLLTSGWLEYLLRPLKRNNTIGIVGPVTNSVGNEQRIDLPGLNETNFEIIARSHTDKQKGVWFQTEKLGFFCVAMHRHLLDQVGYLDERFGIGMFEDDDYCLRARKAGYTLTVTEDCFIYHKGSVSFKKLAGEEYNELFNRNRNLFYEKHQVVWTYADIVKAAWFRLRIDVTELAVISSPLADRVRCRIPLMDDSIMQTHQVELMNANIKDQTIAHNIVAQKHHELMEISDWASALKQQNDELKLQNDALANELAVIKNSFFFRLACRFSKG